MNGNRPVHGIYAPGWYPDGRERIAPPPLRPALRSELLDALGRRRFNRGASSQAAGGNNPQVQIFLPADSRRVVVIDKVIVSSTATQAIQAHKTTTQLAAGIQLGFAQRGRGIAADAQVVGANVALVTGDAVLGNDVVASTPLVIPEFGEVLEPGEGLHFLGATINTLLSVTYYWTEFMRDLVMQT